jgi:hypothetical protein
MTGKRVLWGTPQGSALVGCKLTCLRPCPASEPDWQEQKMTREPGSGETLLGGVFGELGCARRSWARGVR